MNIVKALRTYSETLRNKRQREAEFDNVVNKIAKKYGKRLKFKYTGPWPPYNFVNIRLKLERVSAS